MSGLGFGVIGAGRIGALHARNLAGSVHGARLAAVMDADPEMARRSAFGGADAYEDLANLLSAPDVDAVVIASPTAMHAEQIVAVAEAGKAIFCEKPVALDLPTTVRALDAVRRAGVPFQIGFNRRFDPGYAKLAEAVHRGDIGRMELFRSQSTDPSAPPASYVATSGGIYRDSVIHDLDIARFVGGEIDRVTALGRVLVAPMFEEHGDVDTSLVTLEFASGALGTIQNSRRTLYGHDLRVEVHGEHGKLVTEDERPTKLWRYDAQGIHGDYYRSFLDRFADAYWRELVAFVDAVRSDRAPSPGPADAIEALRLAEAATKSLREGRPVELAEIA